MDVHGNLLFCRDCIILCLDIHTSRLQKQRQIKQRQKQQPTVEMTKKEVTEQRLENYVIRDSEEGDAFGAWWKTVESDDQVEVQYPHERHGLAGRVSNHAKQEVLDQFLEFVDANSQPNGRQGGSYSAQFFFHPKFTRIAPPRVGEKNYEEKAHSSLVYEFNRVQTEAGRPVELLLRVSGLRSTAPRWPYIPA